MFSTAPIYTRRQQLEIARHRRQQIKRAVFWGLVLIGWGYLFYGLVTTGYPLAIALLECAGK
jgi:accessory gene regulator protein AgrB